MQNHSQKGSATIIALVILLFTLGGTVAYFKKFPLEKLPEQKDAQTEKAKKVQGNNTQPQPAFKANETVAPVTKQDINPDTTSWKTYRNVEYGFSFDYPEHILLQQNQSSHVFSLVLANEVRQSDSPPALLLLSVSTAPLKTFGEYKLREEQLLQTKLNTSTINGLTILNRPTKEGAHLEFISNGLLFTVEGAPLICDFSPTSLVARMRFFEKKGVTKMETTAVFEKDQSAARSRDAHRMSDLPLIQIAVENYADDNNNEYPKSLSQLESKYMQAVPLDPLDKKPYVYVVDTSGNYQIQANLEIKNDRTSDEGCGGEIGRYCYGVVSSQ